MKHIFIVPIRPQFAVIANQLATDLRNAGHDTQVDTHELSLGKSPNRFHE